MKKLQHSLKAAIAAMLFMYMPAKAQPELLSVRTITAENKVAVLPLTYIGPGNDVKLEEMRYVLQNITYRFLHEKASELRFQSPVETNAMLLKSGVTAENFRKFTTRELARILQVEYIIAGTVNQEANGLITHRTSTRRTPDNNYTKSRWFEEGRSSSHTTTKEDLNTTIELSIYNDKGDELFSKSRRSILSDADAYKNALHYLLKRTPLYNR